MALRPLNDRILVQRVKHEEMTKGGIIIPETAKEKQAEALVVAVGPGKRSDDGSRQAVPVKTGDRVLFGKYSGTDVKLNNEDYLILRAEDVLAVIED